MIGLPPDIAFALVIGGILYGAIAINFLMERWQIRAPWPYRDGDRERRPRGGRTVWKRTVWKRTRTERIGRKRTDGPNEQLGRWFGKFMRTKDGERNGTSTAGAPVFESSSIGREGIVLNRAFASIADPQLRADVVAYAEAVARKDALRRGSADGSAPAFVRTDP